jgi:hypothetical protein
MGQATGQPPAHPGTDGPIPHGAFPPGFIWGAATAAYQAAQHGMAFEQLDQFALEHLYGVRS